MKYVWTILLASACGGGGGGNTPDAAVDASDVDAPDAPPMVDTDGDGIFDHLDVCPTVADPAQVDLDGDHLGWLCDPVESTTIPHTGVPSDFRLAVRGTTAGATFRYGCATGACESAALSVGPGGVSRADSLVDAWMEGRPTAGWVMGENRVLWSLGEGGLGEHNAATNVFTTKYDGNFQGSEWQGTLRFERDQLVVLPSGSPTQGYGLLEPRENGDVFIIAESAYAYGTQVIAGHAPANLLFTMHTPGSQSLQRFAPGAPASTVSVGGVELSHAWEVKTIEAVEAGGRALMGLCVDQDNVRYLISTDDNNVPGQVLPLPSCDVYGAQTRDHRLRVIVASISGAHSTGGVVFSLDGTLHTTEIAPYGVEVFGHSLPAAVRSLDSVSGAQLVNAVSSAGTIQLVADEVRNTIVSIEGETIHVLAKRGTDHVLFRYRNGTVNEVILPMDPETLDERFLVTTKEGAALISTFETAFVVPSQTMVATELDFDNLRGFVRGEATLFVASHNAKSSKPTLYAYREVNGVPQYTAMTTEASSSLYAYALDAHDGARTEWFVYVKDDTCRLSRAVVVNGSVDLLGNVPCLAGAVIEGVTRDNKLVVRMGDNINLEHLYLLDGDTITKVAVSTAQIHLLYATPDSRVVLGWAGRDTSGSNFACLGAHPERCWTPPLATYTWAAPVPGQSASLHMVFLEQVTGGVKFTSIKAIGDGTRPQPL
ncbi:MAG: thrombospondin type 3 repeat-containing protein [Kofleriaceae bacterium]|nr:thrombospondin type 3 repeat-containing protein [Kofleriaceae bacterium]